MPIILFSGYLFRGIFLRRIFYPRSIREKDIYIFGATTYPLDSKHESIECSILNNIDETLITKAISSTEKI